MDIMGRIMVAFERHPLYSQDDKGDGARVLAHFTDIGNRLHWIVTEASRLPDGDWELFGLCDLGFPEFGYVLLSDILRYEGLVGPNVDYEPCSKTIREFRESLGI